MKREPITWCYIRQSKSRADQKYTSSFQYDECYGLWKQNSARLSMPPWCGKDQVFYDEDFSGRTTKLDERPDGKRLLAEITKGDHLIVWRIDRLGRKIFDIMQHVGYMIEQVGVRIHVANMQGQAMDLSSIAGKCVLMGLALAAEIEGDAISERNKSVSAYLKRAGLARNRFPPSGPGWKWQVTGQDANGKPIKEEVPDMEQRENFNQIWMLRMSGVSEERIAARLNAAGRRTREGAEWSRDKVYRAHHWAKKAFASRFGAPSPENWTEQAAALIDPELAQDPPKDEDVPPVPVKGGSVQREWRQVDGQMKMVRVD